MPYKKTKRVKKLLAWLTVINTFFSLSYGLCVDKIELFYGFIYALILILLNVTQVMVLVSPPKGTIRFSKDMYLVLPVIFCSVLTMIMIGRFVFVQSGMNHY